jgi:filamentous hemagglutinin
MFRKSLALLLGLNLLISPALSLAAPTIPGFYGRVNLPAPPRNALPQVKLNPDGSQAALGATVGNPVGNILNVNQTSSQAYIDWSAFNIGADATVQFNQGTGTPGTASWRPDSSFTALNRIHDLNPSQILGTLRADGKVYLINQNGILFGAGSQVRVHSLVASALDLGSLGLPLSFQANAYVRKADGTLQPLNAEATVTNLGNISTDQLGSVFLIAPNVENFGSINAPNGQIALIGATSATLITDSTGVRPGLVVNPGIVVDPSGLTGNVGNGGSLTSDTGLIGMYGRSLNQNGVIRAVTALRKNGQIELVASDRVAFGADSLTSSLVAGSSESAINSFDFHPGRITVAGLDPAHPSAFTSPVRDIEVDGRIEAPSGQVTMNASHSITLGAGASLSVAGNWTESSAPSTIGVKLNSVTLNDDYGQKDGVLPGTNIVVDPVTGSSIGNLSPTLLGQDTTAAQRSVTGGTISLNAGAGTLVARQGSLLDISGGGTSHLGGNYSTTKLASGTGVYDISNAPEWVRYSKVLGDQSSSSRKFGLIGRYLGLYLGGGAALKDLKGSYTEGADAGKLQVSAQSLALDGTLKASATAGAYQTLLSTSAGAQDLSRAAGTEIPRGGSFVAGVTPDPTKPLENDLGVTQLVLQNEVAPLPEGAPAPAVSSIATRFLNDAGLSSVALYANTGITVAQGARLALNQGGSFKAESLRIENRGSITAPGGSISLVTGDNLTSNPANPGFQDIPQSLVLARGSSLSVAGRAIDNTPGSAAQAGGSASGLIKGGSITLADHRAGGAGVAVLEGALLDVSGGYRMDAKGNLTGGDAGTLSITGATLALDGTLRGLSLPGSQGGNLALQTAAVEIAAAAPAPLATPDLSARRPGLVLGQDQLADTGFSRVALTSFDNVTFDPGVQFSTSQRKRELPLASTRVQGATPVANAYATRADQTGQPSLSPDYLGASSLTVSAGVLLPNADLTTQIPDNVRITLAPGSGIELPPGGSVTLKAPVVDLAGNISAASGTVSVNASQGDLTLTGKILAAGYQKPDGKPLVAGGSAGYTPQAGGSVSLAAAGSVRLQEGSEVDVSGAAPYRGETRDGLTGLAPVSLASDAGSLSLSYGTGLTLAGALKGSTAGAGMKGGTLSIASKSALALDAAYIGQFQSARAGFDDLSFKSTVALDLANTGTLTVPRALTLDAPLITGSGDSVLVSPWIRLKNSSQNVSSLAPATGEATLSLKGGWLDVTGGIKLSGFRDLNLESGHDIRLSDLQYGTQGNLAWHGFLGSAGDLTLKGNNIYPTTLADFSITSTHGDITTLPGDAPGTGTILSAAGRLSLVAEQGGINHTGVIVAPMGQIDLNAPNGMAYLAPGSVLSSAGNAAVNLGTLDDVFWTFASRATGKLNETVSGAPAQSVSVKGAQVVTRAGSTIDISGGGSIFGYQFIPGVEGSVNPFGVKGRYIIVPDQSASLPGAGLYLAGGQGIAAGYYSVLPEQYAFLPGALVLTDLGSAYTPGSGTLSTQGYPVIGGYTSFMGNAVAGAQPLRNFAVRSAAQVMQEGHFTLSGNLVAGNAGSVTLQGGSTVIEGAIRAAALPDRTAADGSVVHYLGGSMALSGKDVTVTSAASASLPGDFGFGSDLPAELAGKLQITDAAVSGKGLEQLKLGFLDPDLTSSNPQLRAAARNNSTDRVTIGSGAHLDIPNLTLSANSSGDAIVLQSGARIAPASDGAPGPQQVSFLAPQGKVVLEAGSAVTVAGAVSIEARQLALAGDLGSKDGQGTLSLGSSSAITLSSNGAPAAGMALDQATLTRLSSGTGFANLKLKSASDIAFQGDVTLGVRGELTLDAANLAGTGAGPAGTVLTAAAITLQNSGATASLAPAAGTGRIDLNADRITVGPGGVKVSGFDQVNLTVNQGSQAGDLVLSGSGALSVDRDLTLTAARVTTSGTTAPDGAYLPADFTLDAARGTLSLRNSGGAAGTQSVPGGSLDIVARKFQSSGVLDLPSGALSITTGAAGGDGGIVLENGAQIRAGGSSIRSADPNHPLVYLPAGSVSLVTTAAAIDLATGSAIDVSALGSADAGSISLKARQGGVNLAGMVSGHADGGGKGGSLFLETDSLAAAGGVNRFTGLADSLRAGGFTGDLGIRAAAGDIDIAATTSLKADNIRIAADAGTLKLSGSLDVSRAQKGGSAQLFGSSLILAGGSSIKANGVSGGEVLLGTYQDTDSANGRTPNPLGRLDLQSGALIDVTGSGGQGGQVSFRAPRSAAGDEVAMDLAGTVKGASRVQAIAVAYYRDDLTSWRQGTRNFMDLHGTAIANRLRGSLTLQGGGQFSLTPGVEIYSSSDLTLNNAIDLSALRYGGAPGELTLRAAGNLNLNANLVDAVAYRPAAPAATWGINLIAGADLRGADYLATAGSGNLSIADNSAVYTANAPLNFASAGDTVIATPYLGDNLSRIFGLNGAHLNLGTLTGTLTGRVGGDLLLKGGVIQSAAGSLDLKVGGDLVMSTASNINNENVTGSVRTTGLPPAGNANSTAFWNYAGGGDISLAVKGAVQGDVNPQAWDVFNDPNLNPDALEPKWSAGFGDTQSATEGIVTLAGGDISVRAGTGFFGQSGSFGSGDLSIYSRGNIGGHFLVAGSPARAGEGVLQSLGNIGNGSSTDLLTVDAFNAHLTLAAQGAIDLGTVLNPTVVRGPSRVLNYSQGANPASVNLCAATGDVTIFGSSSRSEFSEWEAILPPSLTAYAGHDIRLKSNNTLVLAPSPSAQLRLVAENQISGAYLNSSNQTSRATLVMSDMAPSAVYGSEHPELYSELATQGGRHAAVPVHQGDPEPVVIQAKNGDISEIQLYLPKKAEITAAGDIRDIFYSGQNLPKADGSDAGDVSRIIAGRDLLFRNDPNAKQSNTGIFQGGPGSLIVAAGGNIDLGTTKGIQSFANAFDPALGNQGAALYVLAGATHELTPAASTTEPALETSGTGTGSVKELDPEAIRAFFLGKTDAAGTLIEKGIKQYGTEYSVLKANGEDAKAAEAVAAARVLIAKYFAPNQYQDHSTGNISMTNSQISTIGGKDDLSILAAGQIDVGKTTFNQSTESTGIFTAQGGGINVFAGRDLNVNESRLMTFMGGDLVVWSDHGDIKAGRGSKTTVSASPPRLVDMGDGTFQLQFQPPSVGSGMRALTFDPDGASGPREAPKQGDGYIFSPEGVIDAGEAGIAAGTLTLGGGRGVVNAGEIVSGAGSIGVPVTSEATVILGSLNGSGSVNENSKMIDQSSTMGGVKERAAQKVSTVDDFMSKWLDLRIISFDGDPEPAAEGQGEQDAKKAKKK